MRAKDILALWDALDEKCAFPYGSFGYSEKFRLFECVLSVYKSPTSWALVFEQIGYWYITAPSEAANWVRVVRPDSDPEQAFDKEYPPTACTITTDDVTNDPAAEESDEEVIAQAAAEGNTSIARLQELRVDIDGRRHVLRPSLDDWRCSVHADVGPVSYAANVVAPHLAVFHLATQFLREEVRMHDPREFAGLSSDYDLVFRDDGPDPLAHLGDEPYSPSASPYWRELAALLAGDVTTTPRRQSPIERAIRKSLGLDADTEVPADLYDEVTTLNIGDSDATDLVGIERLVNLQKLYAFRTAIADLRPLAALKKLNEVSLPWTRVSDLSPLAGKRSLEKLDVSYTPVHDLSPLAGLWLRDLRLSGSDVTEVKSIAEHPLSYLSLDDTLVEDTSPVARVLRR